MGEKEKTDRPSLKELQSEADRLQKIFAANVTEGDFCLAVCRAVLKEFPVVAANPEVVEFLERVKEFHQKEKEGRAS